MLVRTHLPAQSWRTYQLEKGYQPDIARDLAKVSTACRAAVRDCPDDLPVELAAVVDHVIDVLTGAGGPGDIEQVTVAALTTYLSLATEAQLESLERSVSALASSASEVSVRTAAGQLDALRACLGERARAVEPAGARADVRVEAICDALAGEAAVTSVVSARTWLVFEDELRRGAVAARLVTSFRRGRARGDLAATCATEAGRGVAAVRLRDAVIRFESLKHLRLVYLKIDRLASTGKFHDVDPDDLFTFGYLGLIRALLKYDPDTAKFSTYAMYRIGGAIRDGVRAESPVPKRATTQLRKIRSAVSDLTQLMGRKPTMEEISDAVRIDLDKIRQLQRLQTPKSIDEMVDPEASFGRDVSWMSPVPDPATLAQDTALREALDAALRKLPCDQQTAVQLLVIDELTMAEASARSGMSTSQLRRARAQAVDQLQGELADWR